MEPALAADIYIYIYEVFVGVDWVLNEHSSHRLGYGPSGLEIVDDLFNPHLYQLMEGVSLLLVKDNFYKIHNVCTCFLVVFSICTF